MAGAGYKLFNTGDVLTAAQVNTYLMEQTVMVFADAAARTAALSGVVSEGMISYLKDTNAVEVYNGSAWVASDDPNAIQNTIVDAKGDLITATAADTPARLAVGNNGDTLVADSSASTGLRWQSVAQLNPVINSNFSIWQRGTSTTDVNGPSRFGADRWQVFSGTSGRTISRQLTNDTTNLPNIQYCIRLARDSGNTATNFIALGQNFETATSYPFAGKTVTYSFYARKGANFSGTFNAKLTTGTGTDENGFYNGYVNQATVIDYSPTLTTTWQRFSASVSIASNVTEMLPSFSTGTLSGTAGAADFVEITGVQLEIGSVATAYRPLASTLAGEFQSCMRYFYRMVDTTSQCVPGAIYFDSTSTAVMSLGFPVVMRTNPSLTATASNFRIGSHGGVFTTCNSISLFDATNESVTIVWGVATTPFTAGYSGRVNAIASGSPTLDFSAEL